ncbi:PilN domain-containing protein [Aestuariibaculum sediminum]|uniref:Uncharacterized protein n=1 Tax=Aestuariibaculum sediminum TaxID=2770637 RepID=A0A8J6QJE4_9FLAO|nr:PilN domain-containing protein [Aestuariibaculum sediminum]MBD0832824.1 hypothetical protein [Aestuariibaculum sediminum]
MIAKVKTFLEFNNRFCGIEHTFRKEGTVIYITKLKKQKKKLIIDGNFEIKKPIEIRSILSKNTPIFLVVNTDQVLTKLIESNQKTTLNTISLSFPNINIDEFYYQFSSFKNKNLLSICRKSYIDNLLKQYKELGIPIINLSIGNQILSTTIPYLKDNIIRTSNAQLKIINEEIIKIEKKEDLTTTSYEINGLIIDNPYLLSFSGALDSVLQSSKPVGNLNNLKHWLKNEYIQTSYYYFSLKIALFFVLFGLLINFFVFNKYYSKVQQLKQSHEINQADKRTLQNLTEKINTSRQLTEGLLKNGTSKSSYYLNCIIDKIPSNILLESYNYQPLLMGIKEGKTIDLNTKTIYISGVSSKSKNFSKWILNLENLSWIESIEISNYKSNSMTTSTSSFGLTIHMIREK